jgi:hypothetical protein
LQKSVANPFDPPASQLKPAIRFLRILDIPASRIAATLGETADNIRHIDSRFDDGWSEVLLPVRISDLPHRDRSAFASKSEREAFESTTRLEDLQREIAEIRQEHGPSDLAAGYKKLRNLVPRVSSACRPHALRVRAELEGNIAWFSTHLGLAQTSYFYAKEAMEHWSNLYSLSSVNKGNLIAYADAALIASNSLLISRRPQTAIRVLDLTYRAKFAAGEGLDSEWYRQLGTALLQWGGYDQLARKLYLRAGQELELKGGYSHPASIQMNRDRQQNLLNPKSGWERALALIADTTKTFGEFSLEHVMAINWAAAVGFGLDSRGAGQRAQELLNELIGRNLPFEHQGTVTKLLSMTPQLKLKGDILDRWIRFALYQNAAISK